MHHEEMGIVWIDAGCKMQDARYTMKIHEDRGLPFKVIS